MSSIIEQIPLFPKIVPHQTIVFSHDQPIKVKIISGINTTANVYTDDSPDSAVAQINISEGTAVYDVITPERWGSNPDNSLHWIELEVEGVRTRLNVLYASVKTTVRFFDKETNESISGSVVLGIIDKGLLYVYVPGSYINLPDFDAIGLDKTKAYVEFLEEGSNGVKHYYIAKCDTFNYDATYNDVYLPKGTGFTVLMKLDRGSFQEKFPDWAKWVGYGLDQVRVVLENFNYLGKPMMMLTMQSALNGMGINLPVIDVQTTPDEIHVYLYQDALSSTAIVIIIVSALLAGSVIIWCIKDIAVSEQVAIKYETIKNLIKAKEEIHKELASKCLELYSTPEDIGRCLSAVSAYISTVNTTESKFLDTLDNENERNKSEIESLKSLVILVVVGAIIVAIIGLFRSQIASYIKR